MKIVTEKCSYYQKEGWFAELFPNIGIGFCGWEEINIVLIFLFWTFTISFDFREE